LRYHRGRAERRPRRAAARYESAADRGCGSLTDSARCRSRTNRQGVVSVGCRIRADRSGIVPAKLAPDRDRGGREASERRWIPACAGMTAPEDAGSRMGWNDGARRRIERLDPVDKRVEYLHRRNLARANAGGEFTRRCWQRALFRFTARMSAARQCCANSSSAAKCSGSSPTYRHASLGSKLVAARTTGHAS
jgi:hypothetical protein